MPHAVKFLDGSSKSVVGSQARLELVGSEMPRMSDGLRFMQGLPASILIFRNTPTTHRAKPNFK